jgi:hypothetical protein
LIAFLFSIELGLSVSCIFFEMVMLREDPPGEEKDKLTPELDMIPI